MWPQYLHFIQKGKWKGGPEFWPLWTPTRDKGWQFTESTPSSNLWAGMTKRILSEEPWRKELMKCSSFWLAFLAAVFSSLFQSVLYNLKRIWWLTVNKERLKILYIHGKNFLWEANLHFIPVPKKLQTKGRHWYKEENLSMMYLAKTHKNVRLSLLSA